MVSEEEVQKAFQEFHNEFKPKENKELADARSSIIARKVTVKVNDDFSFEISTKILPKHIRLIQNASKVDMDHPETFDYDTTVKPLIEFLSDICIDKDLDFNFWKKFDEETGYVPALSQYIMNNLESSTPKVEIFR